jgi:hypothetical protein
VTEREKVEEARVKYGTEVGQGGRMLQARLSGSRMIRVDRRRMVISSSLIEVTYRPFPIIRHDRRRRR